jgi:hypothetical protein
MASLPARLKGSGFSKFFGKDPINFCLEEFMKKLSCLFLTGALALIILSPAFAGGGQAKSGGSTANAASWNDAPLAEIKPVSQLPFPPKKIPPSQYAYDDLSRPVTIELLGYNYGVITNTDPIATYLGKKYNARITYTTVAGDDLPTVISTRFAARDYPDAIILGGQLDLLKQLYDAGQLMDAQIPLRYMPNAAQYFTEDYHNYISYKGAYLAVSRYPIQGSWNPFVRKDWLAKLNMKMPSNANELLTYARAVTNNDPDGNGRKDTWFAGGAGNGRGFGMLEALLPYFGNPGYNIKNGKINHPMLDGTRKEFISFLRTLQNDGLLAPDWYTIDWESFKSYSLNDKIGYVNYPASNLNQEQMIAKGLVDKPNDTSWVVWDPLPPFSSGKAGIAPGPAMNFVFLAQTGNDPVKLKRIAHILDNSLYTGEDYFDTIQGGGNNVFGKPVFEVIQNADGSSFFYVNRNLHPAWTGEYDTTGLANAAWQNIGLAGPPYHLDYYPQNNTFNQTNARHAQLLASYTRWPSNYTVQIDPETAVDLSEFELREFPKFVFGSRPMSDWDNFVKEWLNAGGRKALTTAASQMSAANFE